VDIFISVLFIADIIYVRAYGHLITFHMVLARNVLNGLWDIIFSLTRWSDFLFLSDIPLLLLISSKTEWKNASRRILLFFTSFVLSAAVLCLRFIQLQESKAISDFKMHTLWMSPIGNHMYDIYSFIYESTDPLSEKETTEVDTWLENNRKFSGPSADFAALEGMSRGKNLIIIQFESLESFLIGRSFYGQEITPNINKLLGSSIYFRNIVEQVMDGNSSDAEFMFNTSLYPIRRGSTFISFGDKEYPSLQKLLKDMEYTTIAIHGDDREYWNRDEAFPALGFDRYIDETDFIDKTAIGMGISDCSLFKQTALEIEDLREPFSIFVITLTSHGPFNIGENKYLDLPLKDVSSDYLQSIHYTDKMFGEFYEWLSAKGYL
jgi:phosphoglycerol transferase MdoB-like AlkP superfamily enzyme